MTEGWLGDRRCPDSLLRTNRFRTDPGRQHQFRFGNARHLRMFSTQFTRIIIGHRLVLRKDGGANVSSAKNCLKEAEAEFFIYSNKRLIM